jgi:DNA repair protein RadA/Sms
LAKRAFRCSNCNNITTKWMGICDECGASGTIDEDASALVTLNAPKPGVASAATPGIRAARAASGKAPQRVGDVKADSFKRFSTGLKEFDRVLGGGLVPGGVLLLAGVPGVGKSSILLSTAKALADQGKKVLIVSGEETEAQIASRAHRTNALSENLYLLSESSLPNAVAHIYDMQPDIVIVDSIQTMVSENSEGRHGSPTQMNEVASELTNLAKSMSIPMLLIGHVTKDGAIAGPRTVEHLVDVVLYFEGTSDSPLRLLRGVKNRYGAVDEIGCFEHTEDGLIEVSDPSGFFLNEHDDNVAGYATSILVEGNRALPIEIQALVTTTNLPNPRKISNGLDHGRVMMVQAILEKHGHLRLQDKDVYVSTSGGLLTKDSSIDLAIAAAIISSHDSIATPDHSVFLGETSLTGEIRQPRSYNKRVNEAKRLGFNNIFAPSKEDADSVKNIVALVKALRPSVRDRR